MKTNAIVRIVLFSIAILVLGGILISGMLVYTFVENTNFHELSNLITSFAPTISGNVESVGSVNASDIRYLEIDWPSGTVTINVAEADSISFSENSGLDDREKMVWNQSGNKLTIHSSSVKTIFGIQLGKSKDLVITVPTDWYCEEMEISVVSADIKIDGFTIDNMDVEAVSGKCVLEDMVITDLNIDTVDGNVFYRGIVGKIECNAVSADLHAELASLPNRGIELSTVDGSIDLILPEDAGFAVELETVSGNFQTDFSCAKVGNRYVCGDGGCEIVIEGVSGNVTINQAK